MNAKELIEDVLSNKGDYSRLCIAMFYEFLSIIENKDGNYGDYMYLTVDKIRIILEAIDPKRTKDIEAFESLIKILENK